MRLVLLGAPGSGKGTQATRLEQHFKVPHISTGDLLRAEVAAGSPLGQQAKEVMERGELVSDEILLGMLESRLSQQDVKKGFILDGYPRNLVQAAALNDLLEKINQPLTAVVQLDVDADSLTRRIATRAAIESRTDDNPESVRKRLEVYQELTAPVVGYYESRGILARVNGVGTLDKVFDDILSGIRAVTKVG